eukprot:GAHX01001459.1.p1 GENE.GAHX01001459.1~~GAHX01001459.1.p1  ORF type:complete len:450 (-),score=76.56 GAHX01001459.1:46-1395(-)
MRNTYYIALICLLFTNSYGNQINIQENSPGAMKDVEYQSCSDRNSYSDAFEYATNSWVGDKKLKSGYLSFLEALTGQYINFYMFNRYGMTEPVVNTSSAVFDKSQSFYGFTSICELVRYGYIPYEKIVLNICVGETCGHGCDTPSASWLSKITSESKSKNILGGLSVGNYEGSAPNEGLFSYKNVILENTDISAFFRNVADGYTQRDTDTPRFILNIDTFKDTNAASMHDFLTDVQKHGFNYIVLNSYDVITDSMSETLSTHTNNCMYGDSSACLDQEYTKILLKATRIDELVDKFMKGDLNIKDYSMKLAHFITDNKLDGVMLEMNKNKNIFDNPDSLCALSIFIREVFVSSGGSIIAISTDIGDMVPFVENVVFDENLKADILMEMITGVDAYKTCYSTLVNPDNEEWEYKVAEGPSFNNGEFDKPDNEDKVAKSFYEVYDNFSDGL